VTSPVSPGKTTGCKPPCQILPRHLWRQGRPEVEGLELTRTVHLRPWYPPV
jgi:hypothetical protein